SFVSFETSMQSLPRVGLSTGRVTDLSPAFNVTWSRLDTVCAPLWGKRDPSRHGARVRGRGVRGACHETRRLSHSPYGPVRWTEVVGPRRGRHAPSRGSESRARRSGRTMAAAPLHCIDPGAAAGPRERLSARNGAGTCGGGRWWRRP